MQRKGIQLVKPPETPGVYLFKDKTGAVLYVGKAKNLKNRLNSYFTNDLLPKTAQMVSQAIKVEFIKVASEFEALLLEANLVRTLQPKYNIELKDDKSPLYIAITKDKYPRILTVRKPEIQNSKIKISKYFGPYLSSTSAKSILRRSRKIFPFSTHLPTKKICIYKQIGLCNPCPSQIEKEENQLTKNLLRKKYLRNVRGVTKILSGKLGIVEKELEHEIKSLSQKEQFEKAQKINSQLISFRNLAFEKDINVKEYLENPNLISDIRENELKDLVSLLSPHFPHLVKTTRLECFDIAHLSGVFPTASMVTFIKGEPDKRLYRHFKIYQKKRKSDVDSMKEVITRRLKHLKDWGTPDLIIIDGGKPQLTAVYDLLETKDIPFIGLAKRFETIVIKTKDGFKELKTSGPALNILQRIRDEAHRFARRLHHKQISKNVTKI